MKCFKVADCFGCPHYDHSGAFTQGGAIPLCGAVEDKKFKYLRKALPYEFDTKTAGRVPTGIIPSWCPLEDIPNIIEAEFVPTSIVVEELPKFKHDCECCRFLGHFGGHDLYFCNGLTETTVVARFGNDGPDYTSGLEFAKICSTLAEAKRRAIAKGFMKENE